MHRNKKDNSNKQNRDSSFTTPAPGQSMLNVTCDCQQSFDPSPYPTPIHYERKTWYSSKIYHIYKFTSIRRHAAQKFKLRYSKYRGRQRSGIDTIRYHTKGEGHSRRSKLRHFSLGSFFSYFRSDWSDS